MKGHRLEVGSLELFEEISILHLDLQRDEKLLFKLANLSLRNMELLPLGQDQKLRLS